MPDPSVPPGTYAGGTRSEIRDWEQVRADAVRAVRAVAFAHPRRTITPLAGELADAVLAVLDEEAVNRMAEHFISETSIKAMDFRNGVSMDVVPSQTLVAHWVAAAKTWLDSYQAVNYTETEVHGPGEGKASMEVKIAGEFDRYAFILQRVGYGKLTPHEARKAAEARADELADRLAHLLDDSQRSQVEEARAALARFAGQPVWGIGATLHDHGQALLDLLDKIAPKGTDHA